MCVTRRSVSTSTFGLTDAISSMVKMEKKTKKTEKVVGHRVNKVTLTFISSIVHSMAHINI